VVSSLLQGLGQDLIECGGGHTLVIFVTTLECLSRGPLVFSRVQFQLQKSFPFPFLFPHSRFSLTITQLLFHRKHACSSLEKERDLIEIPDLSIANQFLQAVVSTDEVDPGV
jgi:hypothetical protein